MEIIFIPNSLIKKFLIVFCFITIVILPSNLFCEMPKVIDPLPEELPMLPRWCQIRILSHPAMRGYKGVFANRERVPDWVLKENANWEKVIGKDIYDYCHHYVWGLNWINRYKRFRFSSYKNAERDGKFALQSAINEFNFMRNHLRPNNKLYYSMLMEEAFVYKELGDYAKVVGRYTEIIAKKPKYAPAYVEYAHFLNAIGKKGDAIDILKSGSKNTSGDKIIKDAMIKMGDGSN